VASEVLGDLFVLGQLIDLVMQNGNVIIGILAKVLEGVAGSSEQDRVSISVEGIERDLENFRLQGFRDCQTNRDLSEMSALFPIPNDYGPIVLTSKSDDVLFFARRESTAHKLTGLELVGLIRCIRESLSHLA